MRIWYEPVKRTARRGAAPERLVMELPFEEAVWRAMRTLVPGWHPQRPSVACGVGAQRMICSPKGPEMVTIEHHDRWYRVHHEAQNTKPRIAPQWELFEVGPEPEDDKEYDGPLPLAQS